MNRFAAFAIVVTGTMACGSPTEPFQVPPPDPTPSPPVQSGITISDLGPETIRIVWTTDVPTLGTVTIHASGLPIRRSSSDRLSARHDLEVVDLLPETAYSFSVTSEHARGSVTSEPQPFTTPAIPAHALSELEVTQFHVLEYEVNRQWSYAPRLSVIESSGRAPAIVRELRFSVDGLGSFGPYRTRKCIAPGEKRALLGEFFGYEVEFGGSRRASGPASAVIVYTDRAGAKATLTVSGPIVPVTTPSEDSGETLTWDCPGP